VWLLGVPTVAVAVVLALLAPQRLWPDEPRRTGALRILGAGLLGVLMVVPLFLYEFAVTVSAGLCGRTGWPEALAGVVAFVVVLTWGFRGRRRILFAFPAAVLAANACALLAAYADPPAHGYCETLSSYVVTV
jgi:hypothetical protein